MMVVVVAPLFSDQCNTCWPGLLNVTTCVIGVAAPSVGVNESKGGIREIIGPAFGGRALTFMFTRSCAGAPTLGKSGIGLLYSPGGRLLRWAPTGISWPPLKVPCA